MTIYSKQTEDSFYTRFRALMGYTLFPSGMRFATNKVGNYEFLSVGVTQTGTGNPLVNTYASGTVNCPCSKKLVLKDWSAGAACTDGCTGASEISNFKRTAVGTYVFTFDEDFVKDGYTVILGPPKDVTYGFVIVKAAASFTLKTYIASPAPATLSDGLLDDTTLEVKAFR